MARWWKEQQRYESPDTLKPTWRYCVNVCSFTFVFSVLEEIPSYINHYQTKVLPSCRLPGPFKGAWGDHYDHQTAFMRLPLRLRDESKRHKIVKALEKALIDFQKQETKHKKNRR